MFIAIVIQQLTGLLFDFYVDSLLQVYKKPLSYHEGTVKSIPGPSLSPRPILRLYVYNPSYLHAANVYVAVVHD